MEEKLYSFENSLDELKIIDGKIETHNIAVIEFIYIMEKILIFLPKK